jgi:hypothetical protein
VSVRYRYCYRYPKADSALQPLPVLVPDLPDLARGFEIDCIKNKWSISDRELKYRLSRGAGVSIQFLSLASELK